MADRDPLYRRHRFPAEIIPMPSSSISSQLADGRGHAGGTRDYCFAPDGPAVGREIRVGLFQRDPPPLIRSAA